MKSGRTERISPELVNGYRPEYATTAADAILDRLVHTSVRFELKGASLRQKNNQKCTESEKND